MAIFEGFETGRGSGFQGDSDGFSVSKNRLILDQSYAFRANFEGGFWANFV